MIKIIKKLSIAMLTASILFATIGTSAHAASKDNKKIQYYKEYQSIIKKVNTSKNKHLQLKDFSAISEKNLLTPTKFEKVVKGDEVADYDDIVAVKNGKWIDRGYGQKTIDAGRTLTLTVTGKAVAGTNMKQPFRKYIEFPMNTNGEIG